MEFLDLVTEYNIVFVWGEDNKPNPLTVDRLAVRVLPIKYIHIKDRQLLTAEKMLKQVENMAMQLFHSPSVPRNALDYFGGEVVS